MSKRPGKGIIKKALKTRSPGEIAELLQVHVSHVYNVESRGVSPTLHQAMLDAGWLSCPPARVRRAVWVHEDDLPGFEAMLARRGVASLQELVDNEMLRRNDDGG